jgi:hypothetical protein
LLNGIKTPAEDWSPLATRQGQPGREQGEAG